MIVGTRIVEIAYVHRVRGVRAGTRKVRNWDAVGTVPATVTILDPEAVEEYGISFGADDGPSGERNGIVHGRRFLQPFQVSFGKAAAGAPADLTFDLASREVELLRGAMASRSALRDLNFRTSRTIHPGHVMLAQDLQYDLGEAVEPLDGEVPEPLWTNEEEARRLAVEAGRDLFAVGDVLYGSRWEPTVVHGRDPRFHDVDLLALPDATGWDDRSLSSSRTMPPASRMDRHLEGAEVDWRFDDAGTAVSVVARILSRDLSAWSRRRGGRASVLVPSLYACVRALHDDAVRTLLGDPTVTEAARRLLAGWNRMSAECDRFRDVPETAGLIVRTHGVETSERLRHLLWLLPRIESDERAEDGDMDALAGAL